MALGLVTLAGCATGGSDVAANDVPLNWPGNSPPPPMPPAPYRPTPTVVSAPPQIPTVPTTGSMSVLPRSAWAKMGVARMNNIVPMNGIDRITVHHDGMGAFNSTDQSSAASRIESVRNSHTQRKARDGSLWADIGYHYVIDPAGRVWEGRDVRYQGAHVEFNNEHNLGIMCLGNYNLQRPTAAQKATLDRFVAEQMRRFRVPITRVYTHQEIRSTECPGSNLQAYMVQTRGYSGMLRLAMARTDSALA
ncbi:MAG: peptidoglycan recognition protein family protein [Phycisphaerales bacterium]